MDNRPLTPLEIIEERRLWRWWLRWFVRHNGGFSFQALCALVTDYLLWIKLVTTTKRLEFLNPLLKALALVPKFCNGLTSNSLTDTAPAI